MEEWRFLLNAISPSPASSCVCVLNRTGQLKIVSRCMGRAGVLHEVAVLRNWVLPPPVTVG